MYRPDEVGIRLRNLRKQYGYSRNKISESIGRSLKYYADIERGTCGMSIATLVKLADFYHISLDYLVNGADRSSDDEQTEWAAKQITGLGKKKKKFVMDVLVLLEEQESNGEEKK